ncbi:MAG: hypothetical protein ABL897_12280 [Hyphomicrobium sp.]
MQYATAHEDRYLLIDDSTDDQTEILTIVAESEGYRPSRRHDGELT